MSQVQYVHTDFVAQMWGKIEGFVASVEPHSCGDWTIEQMKADVHTGRTRLIVFVDDGKPIGAACYVMQNRANARVAFIRALGGKGVTNAENWQQLCAIFKTQGATQIEASMRRATLRLWSQLGFKEKSYIAGVAL